MPINAQDFRLIVVRPALLALVPAGIPYDAVSEDLVIATGAQESGLATWLAQQGDGPARGPFEIEGASLDTLDRRLTPAMRQVVSAYKTPQPLAAQICTNLALAAMVCRLFYWFVPDPLPPHTLDGLWGYYKQYYNTPAGAATKAEFTAALKLTDIRLA